jgi:superfamily II helicase
MKKTKVCVHCHKRKTISHFSKATRYNYDDGLTLWCKECFQEYREKTKEHRKEHGRKYYLEHLAEFSTKEKCVNAGNFSKESFKNSWSSMNINFICVEK